MKASVFYQLIEAIESCQASKGNLRTLIAPIYGPDDALSHQFLKDAEENPLGMSMIEKAMHDAEFDIFAEFPNYTPASLSYRIPTTDGQPAASVEIPGGALTPEQNMAALAAMVSDAPAALTGDTLQALEIAGSETGHASLVQKEHDYTAIEKQPELSATDATINMVKGMFGLKKPE